MAIFRQCVNIILLITDYTTKYSEIKRQSIVKKTTHLSNLPPTGINFLYFVLICHIYNLYVINEDYSTHMIEDKSHAISSSGISKTR